jgi:long-chain fatty acid transport protein
VAKLDFQWHDGWFFALGAEYDLSPKVTLRTGVAYEISPIQNASERLLQLPDADRWWASLGGTYKWSDTMSFDFAYTHIFVEDADVDRFPSSTNPSLAVLRLMGTAESSVDIISASIKTRW